MKIAIVGSGISGLTSAYHLNQFCDITLFEANDYIGGHTHTHEIEKKGSVYHVDTGFIVFNEKTYPNFLKLLKELNVEYMNSSMSFSVSNKKNGLEYNGSDLNRIFADRKNLFRPQFYLFLKGITEFNAKAKRFLDEETNITLQEFYKKYQIKPIVVENYLSPMIASVWSSDPKDVWSLPAKFVLQFFKNHGFLEIDERPQWYVIKGGSYSYVKKMIEGFEDKIRLSSAVEKVIREKNGVIVKSRHGEEFFDAIILATHSDIALRMLSDASDKEREILSAIPYSKNKTFLHQDRSFLPDRKRAFASWNYEIPMSGEARGATVTYNMNILQKISSDELFNVTLNPSRAIDSTKILRELDYEHPLFRLEGVKAQERWSEISGVQHTYFCGAYWRYGFHEDGVVSALRVVDQVREKCKVESIRE